MMRHLIVVSSLVVFSLLSACDRHAPEQADTTVPAADTATPAATPAAAAPESTVPAIAAWGPRKTLQGQAVNPQKTGESGIWIKVEGVKVSKNATITFDGKKVEKVHVRPAGDLVTMGIPLDYLVTPGKKSIVLKPSPDAPEMVVGDFEVIAQ